MVAIEAVTTIGETAALCQSVGLARHPLSASTARPAGDAHRARGLVARAGGRTNRCAGADRATHSHLSDLRVAGSVAGP